MLASDIRYRLMFLIYDQTTTLTGAATTYATLLIALQAMTSGSGSFAVTANGQLVSVSGNGHSATFSQSSDGATPADFSENAGFLRKLYVESKAALISAGTPAPTDLQIWDEMYFRIAPVSSYGPVEMSNLRMA